MLTISVMGNLGLAVFIVIGISLFILLKLFKTDTTCYSIRNGRLIFRHGKVYEIQNYAEFQNSVEYVHRILKSYIVLSKEQGVGCSLPVMLKHIINHTSLYHSDKPNKYGCFKNFECSTPPKQIMDAVEYWNYLSLNLGNTTILYRKDIVVGGIKHLEFVVDYLQAGRSLTTLC